MVDLSSSKPSDRLCQTLVDAIPGLVAYIDPEERYVFVNRVHAEWFGIDRDQVPGRTLSESFPPEALARIRPFFRRALSGETVSYISRLPYPDALRTVRVLYTPDRDPLGAVRGVTVFVQDISVEHEAEQALRTSQEMYRLLANALPQFVWIAGPTGLTEFLNDYWFSFTGASTEEGIRAWDRAVPPEDRQLVTAAWMEALPKQSSFDFEFRIRRASDGVLRWHYARVRPAPLPGGSVVKWIGTAIDIHERKVAEMELIEARRDVMDILDSITDSFIAVDREWRFTYVSARVAELLNTSREELIGRNIWEAAPRAKDSLFYTNYLRVMNERVSLHFEVPYPPDRWFDVHAHPTARGMSAYIVDRTEQKRTEEALRHKAKLESIGLVAGGVAHDFNNLLVGILGAGSMVQDMISPERPEYELVRVITDSAERAAHLTRQMLDYAGRSRSEMGTVNLNRMVRDTVRLLQPSVPPLVHVDSDLDPDLPEILGDPGQLQQVVLNLLTNAVEAIPADKGGRIQITTRREHHHEPIPADLEELPPGDYLALEVRDTGAGMSREVRERIFDPFFTTKFTGRGLGLAAVHGIVRAHKGKIEVASEPGAGTTFRILLAMTPVQQAAPVYEVPRPSSGKKSILIIDDEPVVRATCKHALEHAGFHVVLAENGNSGVARFQQSPEEFETVVVDLGMPDISGLEVIRRLEPDIRAKKVIVSSGFSGEDLRQRLAAAPYARFIQKPYRAQQLIDIVREGEAGAD